MGRKKSKNKHVKKLLLCLMVFVLGCSLNGCGEFRNKNYSEGWPPFSVLLYGMNTDKARYLLERALEDQGNKNGKLTLFGSEGEIDLEYYRKEDAWGNVETYVESSYFKLDGYKEFSQGDKKRLFKGLDELFGKSESGVWTDENGNTYSIKNVKDGSYSIDVLWCDYNHDSKYAHNIEEKKENDKKDIDNDYNYNQSKKNKNSNSSNEIESKSETCIVCGKNAAHSIEGLNGTLEWYCDEHWDELVHAYDSIVNQHTCIECGKLATHSIVGLNGTDEWYCDEHWNEMMDVYNQIIGG